MLLTRETADCEGFRIETMRDWARLAIKGFIQHLIKDDRSKADHGKLRWNRPVGLNIDDNEAHGWLCSRFRLFVLHFPWPVECHNVAHAHNQMAATLLGQLR